MTIQDLNGHPIEITDLEDAIKQSGLFKDFTRADKSYSERDNRLQAYWTDMYNKLVKLNSTINDLKTKS